MPSQYKQYVKCMSTEAQVFRCLLRAHIVRELRKQSQHVLPGLLPGVDSSPPQVSKYQLVSYNELEQVFDRVVTEFQDTCGADLTRMLKDWPANMTTIETFVVEVMRNILVDGHAEWGRMVATAAFLTCVAVKCTHEEMASAIEPLVDYAAYLTDEYLMAYIREHGGWTAFALAFRNQHQQMHTRSNASYAAAAAAAVIIAIVCTIL
jgi:hypothetical protein